MTTAVRRWIVEGQDGRHEFMNVHYKIYFKNDKISDIRNELGWSVEPLSECWAFFSKKFSQHI